MRRTTTTLDTCGKSEMASSTTGLSALTVPRRYPPSAVITMCASQSMIRFLSASAEKPPKTTVCGAPSRAQASIATTVSGIIGI